MQKKGLQVVGFDLNKDKISLYQSGIDPTKEVGDETIRTTTVEFTSDETKLQETRFIIVAVPTPVNIDHTPDLTPVIGASEIVGRNLLMSSAYRKKKVKFKKFDSFVENKLSLTKRYESLADLISDPPKADTVFTGSDQVFNPSRIEEERKAFYLGFLPNGVKKIAYAASFGVKTVPENKKAEITRYLEDFDAVSVRESSGINIVKELSGKSATEVLDPVFLNDKKFWKNVAVPYKEKFENYLFYYRLMSSSESDMTAQKIAKEKNLKLIVMTDGLIKWKADKILRDIGPEEFLYLMNNANYIVTDSFHGVAFSLIFEKQFTFSDMNDRTNERGLNLLQKAGIEQLAYAGKKSPNKELNYDEINERLAKLIKFSKDYISDSLGGINLD